MFHISITDPIQSGSSKLARSNLVDHAEVALVLPPLNIITICKRVIVQNINYVYTTKD